MRIRSVLFALLAGSTFAAAQPGPPGTDVPPPEPIEAPPPEPEPAPLPPPPTEAPVVVTPAAPVAPGAIPPITINITNNNNGNNSNTNTQTNSQANPQTNAQTTTQTATQTNTAPVTVTTTVAAPGMVAPLPPVRAAVDHYELIRAKAKPARWITLGVTHDRHGPPSGIRGSFDLIGRGAWTLGIAATLSHGGEGGHGHDRGRGGDDHGRPSASAIAYIAWTGRLGRLDLRAQVGLGAGTKGESRDDDDTIKRTTTDDDDSQHGGCGNHRLGMRAEAAFLVGLPFGKHLGVVAGPVISAGKPEAGEKAVDAQLMTGLRYRF